VIDLILDPLWKRMTREERRRGRKAHLTFIFLRSKTKYPNGLRRQQMRREKKRGEGGKAHLMSVVLEKMLLQHHQHQWDANGGKGGEEGWRREGRAHFCLYPSIGFFCRDC
jgi:hypothetical protein